MLSMYYHSNTIIRVRYTKEGLVKTETLFLVCDSIITGFFSICYLYQVFFIIYILFMNNKKSPDSKPQKLNRFGVIICARNEQSVIGGLIDSLKRQDYPTELIRIYVVADNCQDYTAEYAEKAGATVFIRNNCEHIGKGYALDYAFKKLMKSDDKSDAYLIFDADNLVDKDFVKEMNLSLNKGYRVLTSYRNSKNYSTNWITSGYSLSFIREAKYLNMARRDLKLCCAISGTGFCVSREIIEKNNGWKHHLLTEDIEFSVDSAIHGERIGISEKSVLYDEQPVTFKSSWNQRLRWAKGFYQVLGKYGGKLIKGIFKGSFACYDFFITLFPATAYTVYNFIKCIIECVYGVIAFSKSLNPVILVQNCIWPIVSFVGIMYIIFFAMGFITMLTEHKKIRANRKDKLRSVFTYPLFMITYCPIAVVAMFKKVSWTPIPHTVKTTIDDLESANAE